VAAMTHARIRTEADCNALNSKAQQCFDELMEQADNARSTSDYQKPMKALAALTGIRGEDVRKCACSCTCPVIFDADDPDAHVIEQSGGYNLGRHQCPLCADRHRETA